MKTFVKFIIFAIIVSIPLYSFGACYATFWHNSLEDFFESYESQEPEDACIYDNVLDLLYFQEKEYDLGKMVEPILGDMSIDTVLLVRNDKVYAMNPKTINENGKRQRAELYEIDLSSGSLEVIYSVDCCMKDESTGKYVGLVYPEAHYYKGSVYIADGVFVFEYNLQTGETKQYQYRQDSLPWINEEPEITVKRINAVDSGTSQGGLELNTPTGSIQITLEYVAKKCPIINELLSMGKLYGWTGPINPLQGFFYEYYLIENTLYLVCNVLDAEGGSNAVILSYDIESDSFSYHNYYFCGDNPNYIIIPKM